MVELASTALGGLADKGVGQRGKEGSGPSFFYCWELTKLMINQIISRVG